MNQDPLTNVFTYGSLMYKEVIGKLVKGTYQSEKATLKNYIRRHVKNAVYPGVIKSEGSQVSGVLYFGVNKQDLATLDHFEAAEYDKDQVEVTTQSGKTFKAIVYRYYNPKNLEDRDWDIQEFEKSHKMGFADFHSEFNKNNWSEKIGENNSKNQN